MYLIRIHIFLYLTGSSEMAHHLPSISQLLHVHCWVRLVCALPSEKVLHETVQSVRMDSRSSLDCRHAVLPNNSKYISGNDLVRD